MMLAPPNGACIELSTTEDTEVRGGMSLEDSERVSQTRTGTKPRNRETTKEKII